MSSMHAAIRVIRHAGRSRVFSKVLPAPAACRYAPDRARASARRCLCSLEGVILSA